MHERPCPLPPLQPLRAFEAAARLASFTRAANELCVTQGAVSRQIRYLEEQLGVALFTRVDRGVHLTVAGERFAGVVHDVLTELAQATGDIKGQQAHAPITIGVTNAFASLWLMPRLTGFRRQEAALDIRVLASDQAPERAAEAVDIVIEYMRDSPGDAAACFLFDEEVFPVCSPGYLEGRAPPTSAPDLLDETLLQLDGEHVNWMDWVEWLHRRGVNMTDTRRPVSINNYPALLQAAVAGQGIALGWRHLVTDYLTSGSLIPLLSEPVKGPGAFWLTPTRPVLEGSPVARLRDWLRHVANQPASLPS